MTDALIQVMNRVPPHALSVFLALEHRSQMDTKVGCTQQELSRTTGYSVEKVREALGWLEEPTFHDACLVDGTPLVKFITISGSGKARKITLHEPYATERTVRFTFEDTDARRLAVVEAELRRLAVKRPQSSRLSLVIQGKPQQLIAEIEGDLGRPLTVEDAYLLGAMVDGFGPERVKVAWRKHAADLDKPFRGLYAMFQKQRFGPSVKMVESEEEHYTPYIRDDGLFGRT